MPKLPVYRARANKAWAERQKKRGLVKVSVHVPASGVAEIKYQAAQMRKIAQEMRQEKEND